MLEGLALNKPPIAIAFLDDPPDGLERWSGAQVPAGCAFWREAMRGKSFYTQAADHYNCAVGSYTHSIALPAGRASELAETVNFMVSSGYIDMSEVPGIPALERAPRYVAYAPAVNASFRPDVVLIAARPADAMLLYEASLRAGAGDALASVMGRPGCAVLPLARKTGRAALSFGCKGNRTFTGLPDDELYLAIPGEYWKAVSARLNEIVLANAAMEQHYRDRQARFPLPVLG